MAISKEELGSYLSEKFPDAEIILNDPFGDGEKYDLAIKSSEFSGLNRVKQHQLVMSALKEILATKLHAISIKTEIKN